MGSVSVVHVLAARIRNANNEIRSRRLRNRKTVNFGAGCSVATDAVVVGQLSVGAYTGINSGFVSKGHGPVTIGRYCAIGHGVTVVSGQHPINRAALQFALYRRFGWDASERKTAGVSIGSDVWIGDRAIVLPEVSIGHGAIIGAGAIVSRDVAPFEIVAGVPAKVIRNRFPDDVIEWLLETLWWEREVEELEGLQRFFEADLAQLGPAELDNLFSGVSDLSEG